MNFSFKANFSPDMRRAGLQVNYLIIITNKNLSCSVMNKCSEIKSNDSGPSWKL